MEDRRGEESASVVFPAYNEAANIEQSVAWATQILDAVCPDCEILIVNDGSQDRTGEIAEQLAKGDHRVRVLHHPTNRGNGAALRAGILNSTKRLIFIIGADLQFDLGEIPNFLKLAGTSDIVIGNRVLRSDPCMRKLNAWGWNTLIRLLFGIPVADVDCGFKICQRPVFEHVSRWASGAMIVTEILVQAQRAGFRVTQIAVRHFPRSAENQPARRRKRSPAHSKSSHCYIGSYEANASRSGAEAG